jgi:transmembrane protein EpsG
MIPYWFSLKDKYILYWDTSIFSESRESMFLFALLLLVPVFMQHIGKRNYEKKNKAALTFFFSLLALLVMLRHPSVGTDTTSYKFTFEHISKLSWSEVGKGSSEFCFAYFNKLISMISDEAVFFFIVSTITIVALIYPTYSRLSTDTSLVVVLFCTMSTFVMMFSGVRQMLAVALGFVAYELTRRRKLFWFFVVVVLAFLVHNSSFMLFIMYPLYHVRITKNWLYVVVPVVGGMFVFNQQIFSVATMILERYTRFEAVTSSTGAYTMLILFALFTIFSFVVVDEEKMDEEAIGLRNFMLLSLVVQLFAPLHTLAMRMSYYYMMFIPLLMPKIIACRSQRWSQIALIARHCMVLFFLAYDLLFIISGGSLDVFPYHFFWETVL